MCNFFSCIVTRDGRVLFTESDRHEVLIFRAGLKDVGIMDHFQRVEVNPETFIVRVDEYERSSWLTDELLDKTVEIAKRIKPYWESFSRAWDEAWEIYQDTCDLSSVENCVVSNSQSLDTAWEVYEKTRDDAKETYIKAISSIEGYLSK